MSVRAAQKNVFTVSFGDMAWMASWKARWDASKGMEAESNWFPRGNATETSPAGGSDASRATE
jgi:hypothetical protein